MCKELGGNPVKCHAPEGSLMSLQKPATGPCSEANNSVHLLSDYIPKDPFNVFLLYVHQSSD
jgi:hypothetical protein